MAGIALPFALGVTLGQFLPESMLPRPDERLITSLFLGTALSVVSVKIVATVVREMKFVRRKVGMTLLASAIIDDTVGWTIIAITASLALHRHPNATTLAQSVLGTGIFLLVSFTLGRRFVFGLNALEEFVGIWQRLLMHLNCAVYFQRACMLCRRFGEPLRSLSLHYRNTKGSAMHFDPVLLSRMQFAWVIAWHNHAMATMATFIQTPVSGFLGEISDRSGWKNSRDPANISLQSWRQ